ncbi:hypothetical protein HK405_001834, partial [Cladochytrium tenue]
DWISDALHFVDPTDDFRYPSHEGFDSRSGASSVTSGWAAPDGASTIGARTRATTGVAGRLPATLARMAADGGGSGGSSGTAGAGLLGGAAGGGASDDGGVGGGGFLSRTLGRLQRAALNPGYVEEDDPAATEANKRVVAAAVALVDGRATRDPAVSGSGDSTDGGAGGAGLAGADAAAVVAQAQPLRPKKSIMELLAEAVLNPGVRDPSQAAVEASPPPPVPLLPPGASAAGGPSTGGGWFSSVGDWDAGVLFGGAARAPPPPLTPQQRGRQRRSMSLDATAMPAGPRG